MRRAQLDASRPVAAARARGAGAAAGKTRPRGTSPPPPASAGAHEDARDVQQNGGSTSPRTTLHRSTPPVRRLRRADRAARARWRAQQPPDFFVCLSSSRRGRCARGPSTTGFICVTLTARPRAGPPARRRDEGQGRRRARSDAPGAARRRSAKSRTTRAQAAHGGPRPVTPRVRPVRGEETARRRRPRGVGDAHAWPVIAWWNVLKKPRSTRARGSGRRSTRLGRGSLLTRLRPRRRAAPSRGGASPPRLSGQRAGRSCRAPPSSRRRPGPRSKAPRRAGVGERTRNSARQRPFDGAPRRARGVHAR